MKFDPNRVDVIDFLEALDVENVTEATEKEVKFSCPFSGHPHGDQNPSAYMNRVNTAWFCHGCKRRGNSVTFLAEIAQISIMEALKHLKGRYGGAEADPDSVSMRDELERFYRKREQKPESLYDVAIDEEATEMFAIDWTKAADVQPDDLPRPLFYMLYERGFEIATLTYWDIGYDEHSNRITIPVRNHEGQLVGFKARAFDGRKPKYLVLGDDPYGWSRYHISKVVFGLDVVLHWQETHTHLIICEGEFNVLALWQIGIKNAVAVSGSNFSETHERLIRRYADAVTIFFDSDQSGWDGTVTVIDKLKDHLWIRVVPDHDGDPASMDESSVRECLHNSESVAKILLEHQLA